MKKKIQTILLIIVSFLICSTGTALPAQSPTVVRPSVAVEFENEVQTLALGFAKAFNKLPTGGKYVVVNTPDGPMYLPDSVRSVEALDGVLLIRMDKGLVHAISARDVVRITNEKP